MSNKATNKWKGFTRAEVRENGEYIGFRELPNGGTEQFFELGGVVFSEVCDENNLFHSWYCVGKKSKAVRYGIIPAC